ncbi:MAG: ParB/RepB/Spo0J family partition protein [Oscillospiraceae bacterium]|nr:ParB/RepB/Spo0J family partition protein [Oscillospiraceae bacterium]
MAKEKKGLGTGLDILFGGNEPEEDAPGLLTLPISKVEPRADQPRTFFDEEALQDLAESIAQYGLIQPILVRKLDSGYYQIIAGERRWRASRLAGLTEIPVRIVEADDRRTAELALVENLQREDLNPIEEAKGYRTLMEDYGLSQEEAARSVGRSRPAVANALRLLSLSPQVMELVEKGELSAGHARALVPIPDERKQLEAAQQVIKQALSVRKTELLAGKILKEQTAAQPETDAEMTIDYAAELSAELSALLGRKVQLIDGRRSGRIELSFYGVEDREALIDALRKLSKE